MDTAIRRGNVTHTPDAQKLGSQFTASQGTHPYALDAAEQYDGLSDWEEDRQLVFAWAKRRLSWGQVKALPHELATSNIRCTMCASPRARALFIGHDRTFYCHRHLRARNRALRKKPLSPRRKALLLEQERIDRDHAACWNDIR